MAARMSADVVVVGVGTCGEDLSLRLMAAGLDVVGVEVALIGGECPYWACLPSKRMIRMGNLVAEGRRANGRAGRTTVSPDWGLVAAQVRDEITGGWNDAGGEQRFHDRGGRLLRGRARLAGPRTVVVGDTTVEARRGIVLATGSRPAVPDVPGLADADYWTTHDVIAAEKLPESVVVLGGGAVGCELGQVMARFGSDVTILEGAGRLLPTEEPEASDVLREALETGGVTVRTGTTATRVGQRDAVDGGFVLDLDGADSVKAERLLVATGRHVELGGLGLETVGLDPRASRVDVDERMRAADGLWAMGDVTGRTMLTHVALYQSAIVAADILGEERPPARYDAVPRAVFTDPEVGAVGLTERQAKEEGRDVVASVKMLTSTFRGWLHSEGNAGLMKFVLDRDNRVLVGATAVGPHAAEMLGFLGLAVHARVPLEELRSMIYAFPTFYGSIGEGIGGYGRGLVTVLDPGYDGIARLDS
jgi:pyruvate/2-oxoglutarate dehydrogenase complex dihydrolipoamide dehydrogenase (E3) component